MRKLQELKDHPLLACLEAEAFDDLAEAAAVVERAASEVIVDPSAGGQYFGLLLAGRLEVTFTDPEGTHRYIADIAPGEPFGEMSLLTGDARGVTITAAETSRVMLVTQDKARSVIAANPACVQQLVRTIVRRLSSGPRPADERRDRPIPLGISAHHVHLTAEHVEALFGAGHELTPAVQLSQPGQFASEETVTLVTAKARIPRVRVLGPVRSRTQVEIPRTEEFELGLDAALRLSGDLAGTPGVTLEGPAGSVELPEGVICAMRHVHMSPADAADLGVRNGDVVRIRVPGDRELIFGDVVVRVKDTYRLEIHIDTDEANAAELSRGAIGYLDSVQHRSR